MHKQHIKVGPEAATPGPGNPQTNPLGRSRSPMSQYQFMSRPESALVIRVLIEDHFERFGADGEYRSVSELRRQVSFYTGQDFRDSELAEREIQDALDALAAEKRANDEIDDLVSRRPDAGFSEQAIEDAAADFEDSITSLLNLTGLPFSWADAA